MLDLFSDGAHLEAEDAIQSSASHVNGGVFHIRVSIVCTYSFRYAEDFLPRKEEKLSRLSIFSLTSRN